MGDLTITEKVLLYIAGFGILQGILLALLVYFHPKSDRTVNKFLAMYIGCMLVIMSGPLIMQFVRWQDNFFIEPFSYLIGPLLYLYIRSFKEQVTFRKAFPHLIIFFCYFIVSYTWLQWLDTKSPGSPTVPEESFRSPEAYFHIAVRSFLLFLYYFLARRELIRYQRSIRHVFSDTSKIDLRWGWWLINGFIFIIISAIIIYGLMIKYPENFYMFYLLTIAVATPYIYVSSFKGIFQPSIWQKKTEEAKHILVVQMHESEIIEKERSVKPLPAPPNPRNNELIARITGFMEKEKLFQEAELTLQNLADKLNTPSYQVSQAINDGMNKNFYDLVNSYRVEEAKRLLQDTKNRNFTILSVGFEAGFNSKTTFNTVFKRFTGLTPTAFRDKDKKRTNEMIMSDM